MKLALSEGLRHMFFSNQKKPILTGFRRKLDFLRYQSDRDRVVKHVLDSVTPFFCDAQEATATWCGVLSQLADIPKREWPEWLLQSTTNEKTFTESLTEQAFTSCLQHSHLLEKLSQSKQLKLLKRNPHYFLKYPDVFWSAGVRGSKVDSLLEKKWHRWRLGMAIAEVAYKGDGEDTLEEHFLQWWNSQQRSESEQLKCSLPNTLL